MSQFDLLLIQNTHASGVEYSEKIVNIAKGGIISAAADGTPTVLVGGTDGYQLIRDDAEVTGMKWVPISGGHTQGTDNGTTSAIFELDSDGYKIELTAESASKFGVKVDGGATYADLQAKDAIFATATDGGADPTQNAQLANKQYVDKLLATNDAMVFKGTIGTGGTHTIAAFNALTTYNAGWTYRITEAGTVKGVVIETKEIGSLIMATVDRAGSGNVDGDFVTQSVNLDGAVIGPASVTDNYLALFDGATGKVIKAGSGAPGTMAYETALNYVTKALYDANSILYATADNTPAALALGASTVVGRKATGDIVALTPVELANVLTVAVPASKTAAGTAGMEAYDANYRYKCIQTGTEGNAKWARQALAANWV